MNRKGDEKMNKTDKQTLDMLREEFAKSSETAKVPLRLQKESVVTMLKNGDTKTKDFSSETGNKRNNIVVLRRFAAAAAVIAVVIMTALYVNSGGVKVIKTDSFYKGYEAMEPVKNAKSYKDVEKAVQEILINKTAEATKPSVSETDGEKQTDSEIKGVVDSLIEGYSEYVAQANSPEKVIEYEAEEQSLVSQGVVFNGDFNADIVKTDGKYLYIVTTAVDEKTGATVEQIKIVKAAPAEEMQVVSTLVLSDGVNASIVDECIEIYLKNNKLIALINRYSYALSGTKASDKTATVAVYYDISDPASPKKLREHVQEGGYVTSGLYENRLNLVTEKSIPSTASQADGVIPSYSINGEEFKLNAEDIFIAVNDPEASYLFITVTDISDLKAPVGRLAVLGSGKEIYCSAQTIAVARGFVSKEPDENGVHDTLTEIYRFNINGSSVEFSGSYIVNGSLAGRISVDEKSGYLKAATTLTDSANIYILSEKMEFVSGLTGILNNKKIKSVKFIGGNAYFVAADEKEETVIIDLSDPTKPSVAGSISTEGFSQELYSVSPSTLLGISTTADNTTGILLLDVSDPKKPKSTSVYKLEGDFVIPSQADSRCIWLDTEKNLFGIPVINKNPSAGKDISAYILFDVADGAITPVGTYNHDTAYTGDAAVRAVCIGQNLYTVSGERVVAFSIDECTVISSQAIR